MDDFENRLVQALERCAPEPVGPLRVSSAVADRRRPQVWFRTPVLAASVAVVAIICAFVVMIRNSSVHRLGSATSPTATITSGTDRLTIEAALQHLGETSYPDLYAGLSAPTESSEVLVLYLVSGDGDAIKTFQHAAEPFKLSVVLVENTLARLSHVAQQVEDSYEQLASMGIKIAESGVSVPANRVSIGVLRLTDAMAKAIYDRFGGSSVVSVFNAGDRPVRQNPDKQDQISPSTSFSFTRGPSAGA